ncbi:hypothetical protein FACS189459_3490 [Bacilli bacterium]|nr:hypothetical protein FACS189459_3490 [Bacilli bacterium]
MSITDVLKKYKGIEYVLSTDISKDGMLEGTNIEFYTKISKQFPDIKFIASGGISNYNDINELENNNIYGCVIGKALFENKVKIEEVIK